MRAAVPPCFLYPIVYPSMESTSNRRSRSPIIPSRTLRAARRGCMPVCALNEVPVAQWQCVEVTGHVGRTLRHAMRCDLTYTHHTPAPNPTLSHSTGYVVSYQL